MRLFHHQVLFHHLKQLQHCELLSLTPDSIQFNLINLDTDEIDLFEKITSQSGLNVQIFGRTKDNARAFWNWQFLPESFELPKTRKMLMSACDVRLPSRLTLDECKAISDVILSAISTIKSGVAA